MTNKTKGTGVNEQIKNAKSQEAVRMWGSMWQPGASQKTLRKRARLVKRRLEELNKKVVPASKN